jgi:phosphoglycolate phosphatase
MNFESLIFDIDGTLWDSRALVAEGFNLQLKDEGMERFCTNADALKSLFGKVINEIADNLFPELPPEVRYPLMERCMEREDRLIHQSECDIGYPKVKETLEILAKNHRLFIVSNSQKHYPELCIDKMGLGHLISAHLCFGDTGTCKGETIKKLMKDHNITSACYIGDTAGDMEASEYAGIPFIFCTFGFGEAPRYWKKIDKFEQLLEL